MTSNLKEKLVINKNGNPVYILNEDENAYKAKRVSAWRVGGIPEKIDSGIFFTTDPKYFDVSDTGYSRKDAVRYELDLSGKVFDPVTEWGDDMCIVSWSHIDCKCDLIDKYGLYDYSDGDDDEWGIIDTDSLAYVGKRMGVDATILRDVPSESGWGKEFTEIIVYNRNIIR